MVPEAYAHCVNQASSISNQSMGNEFQQLTVSIVAFEQRNSWQAAAIPNSCYMLAGPWADHASDERVDIHHLAEQHLFRLLRHLRLEVHVQCERITQGDKRPRMSLSQCHLLDPCW